MGDIRRQRKKYSKPSKPWEKERISKENALIKEYGFKNKREFWKLNSLLNKFKEQAKNYVRETPENLKFRKELFNKVYSLRLIDEDAKIDDILSLDLKALLERRLQTIVYKSSLAMTIKQARQFITHGFILVGDKKVTSPSYLVKRGEENLVKIDPNASISSPEHPEIVKIMNRNRLLKEAENKKETETESKVEEPKKDNSKKTEKPKNVKKEEKKVNGKEEKIETKE